MIRYLRASEIDKGAWDARLHRCTNKLWYGLSTTLDAAAGTWDALIDEEQGAQLALPFRRKFGITYLHQPFMLQQLGPFSPAPTPTDAVRFLDALPRHTRFTDIYVSGGAVQDPRFREQRNITLQLGQGAEEIRAGYSENHRRNLKKAREAHLDPVVAVPTEELLTFLRNSEQFRRWGIDAPRLEAMDRLLPQTERLGQGFTRGVRHAGKLVAGAFFVRWEGRLIFLKGLTDQRGRELRAMHHLLDQVIVEHAAQPLIFDFAGSNDPDLARFYLGFGGEPSVYLRALINRLPPLLKQLKNRRDGGATEQ